MTWGISGPNFLIIYGSALGVLIVVVRASRRAMLGGRRSGAMEVSSPLSVDEIAYLSGGAAGLGASALVALRENGEATLLGPRQLVAVGSLTRQNASPSQQELHGAMGRAGGISPRRITPLIARSRAASAARQSLTSRGLMTSAAQRSRIRLLALLYLALMAVGVLRLADGVRHERPVTYLALLLVVTLVFARYSLRVPNVTRAGRGALRQARVDADALRGGSLPGDRAMAVALFGIGALWLAEPALASELGFARAQAVRSGSDNQIWNDTSSSCGGSSSCGSSSCGGSSCGGGCGG